jgi:CHAD domain-containing protein
MDTKKQAAAAAALAGGAAIGGKVAHDTRANSKQKAERAFRLHKGESTPDGIRRIARGQLDAAYDELVDGSKRKLATAVHDTRKGLKRLRATVRLAREPLGDELYRRENTSFRDIGRRLAGVRDASVLIETLTALEKASGDDLPRGVTTKLRAQLDDERAQALESLKADNAMVATVTQDIDSARTRSATWTFDGDGFDALEPGLRRIYRRGRNAMQRAQEERTNENLHDWRKRVKDLWHAEQILEPASPKKMKKLAKRTHGLADLLGDDHDLAELSHYVATHPQCFHDGVAQEALMAAIERRRKVLQDEALAVGTKVYRRRPKRFVQTVGRSWRKRARSPATAAG